MTAISVFTYTILKRRNVNGSPSTRETKATIACGDGALTYPTGGISVTPASLGCPNNLESLEFVDDEGTTDGFIYKYNKATGKILFYQSATLTPAGSVAAPTFTGSTPTFTGTSPAGDLNLATPAFSGTGLTASGQTMTTTDNQTMTLNQCAGMWLVPATGATPPMLILSNTAVTGAPAVFTCQGACATDAGAYKVVKDLTPVGTNAQVTGTNSAPAFTGTAIAAAALTELPTTATPNVSFNVIARGY